MRILVILSVFVAAPLLAQEDRPVRYRNTDPTGACRVVTGLQNNWLLGKVWQCVGASHTALTGTWQLISSPNSVLTTGSYADPAWITSLNWAKLTSVPSTFAPSAHATSHKNGGTDEVATATAAANAIPKAGAGGTLASGWIPTLNQSTSGNAATATAADHTPTLCAAGQAPRGVDAAFASTGCAVIGAGTSAPIQYDLVKTSATVATLGGVSCTSTTPCVTTQNNVPLLSTVAGVTATLSGTSNSGTLLIYVASNGTLTAGHNTSTTVTGSAGLTVATGISGFPADSCPMWQATWTANVFDAIVISTMFKGNCYEITTIIAGTGLTASINPTNGQKTLSATGTGDSMFTTTSMRMVDNFPANNVVTAAHYGQLSWNAFGTAVGNTTTGCSSVIDQGWLLMFTAASNADFSGIALTDINSGPQAWLSLLADSGTTWRTQMILCADDNNFGVSAYQLGFSAANTYFANNTIAVIRDSSAVTCTAGTGSTANWMLVAIDNAGATTCANTGVAVAGNTQYLFELTWNGTTLSLTVATASGNAWGAASAAQSITTHVPTAALWPNVMVVARDATARRIKIGKWAFCAAFASGSCN